MVYDLSIVHNRLPPDIAFQNDYVVLIFRLCKPGPPALGCSWGCTQLKVSLKRVFFHTLSCVYWQASTPCGL